MHVVILTDRKESLLELAQGLGGDVEWATAADDVLSRAKTPPWQLVVVDAMMPGMQYKTFLLDLLRVNAMLNTVSSRTWMRPRSTKTAKGWACSAPCRRIPGASMGSRPWTGSACCWGWGRS